MWTKAHRAKQAGPDRRSQRYPTDTEWILIEPWLPRPAKRGRRCSVNLREILNAIRDLARTGSAGAQLILDALRKRWPWLRHLFADGAYDRGRLLSKAAFLDFTLAVIRRLAEQRASRCCRDAGWSSAASAG
ncbi:transposase [Azospirillum brasilense]|nr:transposase [Azospirillum baldaniorum]TWA77939.1 transposase [Azospirillum brasilense]